MATLGSLVVNVAANAQEFQKGMEEAKTAAKGFNSYLQGMGMPSTLLGGIRSVTDGLEQGMKIAGQFKSMGVGIGASAGDMFNMQQQVGEGNMEGLIGGIQKIQRELGAAAAGSQEARTKFEGLGLNWQELSNAKVGDMARTIATRINEAGTAADKSHVRFELMGKSADGAAAAMAKMAQSQTGGGLTGMIVDSKDIDNAAKLNTEWQQFKKEQLGSMDAWDATKVKSASAIGTMAEGMQRVNNYLSGGTELMENMAAIREAQGKGNAATQKADAELEMQTKLMASVQETVDAYWTQAEAAGKTADEIQRITALEKARKANVPEAVLNNADEQMRRAQEVRTRNVATKASRDDTRKMEDEANTLSQAFQEAAAFGTTLEEGLRRAQQHAHALEQAMKGVPTKDVQNEIKAANEKLDQQKLYGLGQQFVEPLQAAADKMKELSRLWEEASQEQLPAVEAAMAAAFGDLAKAALPDLGADLGKLPPALLAGSKEAISAQNRFEREQQGLAERDPAKLLERVIDVLGKKGIEISDAAAAKIAGALTAKGSPIIRKGVID